MLKIKTVLNILKTHYFKHQYNIAHLSDKMKYNFYKLLCMVHVFHTYLY